MDLSVRDAARLLAVSEDTVYRWIRGGSLPAHRVGHQYRLNRVELQEWAASHDHRVAPHSDRGPSLCAALERGGVHDGVAGSAREQVLRAVAQLATIPEGVDRDLLYELLLAREALGGTGLEDGIAVPHPRDPLVLSVTEPYAVLCYLAEPVDFGALDGKPVRSLFLLLTPSVQAHLQLLAKLVYGLHDLALRHALADRAPAEVVLGRVRALEKERERR